MRGWVQAAKLYIPLALHALSASLLFKRSDPGCVHSPGRVLVILKGLRIINLTLNNALIRHAPFELLTAQI